MTFAKSRFLPALLVLGALAIFFYLDFQGYLDQGDFAVEQTVWSPDHQNVAMIAYRGEGNGSGGINFVLVGPKLYSREELSHQFHTHTVVEGGLCLTVHWEGPAHLVVTCSDDSMLPELSRRLPDRVGEVSISYVNIPSSH